MAYKELPLFHPRSRRQVPLALTRNEFRAEFPDEGEFVEFKAGLGRVPLQRTVTAFSNTRGGVLLLGVDDAGNPIGRALTATLEDDVTEAILAVHNPGRYWLHELDVDGVPVSIVAVDARKQGFTQTPDGVVLVRTGGLSVPLMGGELFQFVASRSLVRFDTTPTRIKAEAAAADLVAEIGRAFGWRGKLRPDDERLANEKLVTLTDGTGARLTVAGALTLLRDPSDLLGKAFVEVLRYPRQGIDYDRREEFTGPVQQQVSAATRFVMDELGTDLVVVGVKRYDLPKLPEVVLREAIANAVAHRSYEELGRPIRVELRPDVVVVESPGGLPEPVTEANIRETQSARNVNVIRVLRRLQLAEDSGRGVDVMQDSMAAALLDPPRFRDLGHSVRVELPVQGAVAPQERAWILDVERRGRITPRDRILLVHAARGDEMTNERVRDLLGVDSRDARTALKRLRDAGLLVQLGQRGGARYLLAPSTGAPAAFRMTPAALEDLVVSLATEAPITNAAVREATGLDRAETLRLLDRLVRAGRLIRHGERRGTRYTTA